MWPNLSGVQVKKGGAENVNDICEFIGVALVWKTVDLYANSDLI